MSTKHLFGFGYESPHEFRTNSKEGTDFESSRNIWITGSEEAALEWGQAVATQYVAWLFNREGEAGYAWDEGRFAYWLEDDQNTLATARTLDIPSVVVGEMPAFDVLEVDG